MPSVDGGGGGRAMHLGKMERMYGVCTEDKRLNAKRNVKEKK